MERHLPQPLDAEIVDEDGRWLRVSLFAYLGADRWRATTEEGRQIVVHAGQIVTINEPLPALPQPTR